MKVNIVRIKEANPGSVVNVKYVIKNIDILIDTG